MLFRPRSPAKMWDTTVYEENGVVHIFYLAEGASPLRREP